MKQVILFISLLVTGIILAQTGLRDPGFVGGLTDTKSSVQLTCKSLIEQDASNDFLASSPANTVSQKIRNSSTVKVCKVFVWLYDIDSSSCTITLTSDRNGGTTYQTSESETVSLTGGYVEFEFLSTADISGDFWINVVTSSSISKVFITGTNPYEGTSYCVFQGSTGLSGYDMRFKLHSMQP